MVLLRQSPTCAVSRHNDWVGVGNKLSCARKSRDCEFAFVQPRGATGVLLEYIDDKTSGARELFKPQRTQRTQEKIN